MVPHMHDIILLCSVNTTYIISSTDTPVADGGGVSPWIPGVAVAVGVVVILLVAIMHALLQNHIK